MQNQEIQILQIPDFSSSNFLGFKTGLRPYRKGGVNLNVEKINNKIIFHNYGHGGAGVSTAYGYALIQYYKFIEQYRYDNEKEIAVLGGGYLGLFTAFIFSKFGYKVKVYAEEYVKKDIQQILKGERDNTIIVSQIAGGYWMPFGYEFNKTKEQWENHKFASMETFKYYQRELEIKKFKGLKYLKVIQIDDDQETLECLPDNIITDMQKIKIKFGKNHTVYEAKKFNSIQVEGDIFLDELMNECSSVLFNDGNLIPVFGQLAVYQSNTQIDYYLSGPNGVRIYPSSFGFYVGKSLTPTLTFHKIIYNFFCAEIFMFYYFFIKFMTQSDTFIPSNQSSMFIFQMIWCQ
ncbi:hypothetical protein IMG5_177110 [Ichthyophthirius multifiliis]|uniref:FAD dependent oxidoreductase domain-containing protein n=1 Tax=Ichthyophthirius multifiliis TaxID=5932 RepID=G0R2E5_ICHMU|nr:hypothetical protein IMG5_177110 [Ichthyophthirius multifiliis]EGR28364.1 hypothetical protein IMG5_177110 [Ichthyophthirius multifiliis]|eukprot:XP_004027709.1 hypothetical protein IMG5_177110 [Ichthyophthirius multifiliis]